MVWMYQADGRDNFSLPTNALTALTMKVDTVMAGYAERAFSTYNFNVYSILVYSIVWFSQLPK